MQTRFRRFAILLTAGALVGAAHADLKITTQNTMGGQTTQGTTYIKGARQRSEMQMGPMHQVTITQCDRRQTITISDACRTYMVAPMDDDSAAAPGAATGSSSAAPTDTRKGGTLTIHSTSTNTGETRPMFGYTARRIKTRMTMSSSPNACNPVNMTMESDGWYSDFAGGGVTCAVAPRPGGGMGGGGRAGCQDRVRYTGTGRRNPGYPMKLTTTMDSGQGQTFSMTQETTDLSKATLDPALFEVPAGYRKVDDYQGLMCQAAMSGMGAPPPARSDTRDSQLSRRRRGGSGALCLAPFENKTATSFDDEQWRDTLVEELQNVRVESIKLESRNLFDLEDEARSKGCRHILYSDVMELKQPSRSRRLGSAVGTNSARHTSAIHVELMPLEEFVPWLETTVDGAGDSFDTAGEDALQTEAQQVAVELSKPR
jgi:hypothetical protein